ncbi:MAG: hypothetical protein QM831_34455 [Kofleriaceae bacterium]
MAATSLVLLGVPAFVGQVTGQTTIGFFTDETTYDPALLINVDLAKNTSLPPAQWATGVDCDIATTGGWTTIGPTFNAGPHVGGVWLADRLVQKYANVLASWPPSPDARYQYQGILRADDAGNVTRYLGFKVQVLTKSSGTLVHVAFISPGQSAPTPSSPTRWIDTADPQSSDARANGFTTIDPTSPVGTVGALFATKAVVADGPGWPPKVPIGFGY